MKTIIIISIIAIVAVIASVISAVKGESTSVEGTKLVRRRFSRPKFSTIRSTPENEREAEVDRLLAKRRKLSLAEMQYIYEFLIDTGKEKWRYIKGYEGYYRISSYGMIESCRYERRYLDPSKYKTGYRISLCVNTNLKVRSIHNLVAETFIPNPTGAHNVKPKDGNYFNCDVRNLQWKAKTTPTKVALAV